MRQLFAFVDYRYGEFDDPTLMAQQEAVELVVLGTIEGFEPGPAAFPDEPAPMKNVVMTVSTEDVFKGEAAKEIRVLLPQGPRAVEDFTASLPTGTHVALYLSPVSDSMKQDLALEQQAVTYWLPATPQGFIVDDLKAADVAFPLGPELAEDGETLRSLLPR